MVPAASGSQSSPAVCTPHLLFHRVYPLGCHSLLTVSSSYLWPEKELPRWQIFEKSGLTQEAASREAARSEHLCCHPGATEHVVERADFGVAETWVRILILPFTGIQLVQDTQHPGLSFFLCKMEMLITIIT